MPSEAVGGRPKLLPGIPLGRPTALYHFSEDPGIQLFQPRAEGRPLPGRAPGEALVWAIDEHHAPLYYFPRDCPRIVLWALEDSDAADVKRWIASPEARPGTRMVAHIESAWLDRFEQCRLYRYTFSAETFESIHDHGTHVSRKAVAPLTVEPVGALREALEAGGAELRVVESLEPLAEAWRSSLHISGIRLRNAQGWTPPA